MCSQSAKKCKNCWKGEKRKNFVLKKKNPDKIVRNKKKKKSWKKSKIPVHKRWRSVKTVQKVKKQCLKKTAKVWNASPKIEKRLEKCKNCKKTDKKTTAKTKTCKAIAQKETEYWKMSKTKSKVEKTVRTASRKVEKVKKLGWEPPHPPKKTEICVAKREESCQSRVSVFGVDTIFN